MKRKVLSFMLTCVMLISMFPTAVGADTVEVEAVAVADTEDVNPIEAVVEEVSEIDTVTEQLAVAKIADKEYASLQTAIDAATEAGGDQEITLLAGIISEDVTITQTEGVNITIKGDGKETVYTGTILIHGKARFEGKETLTLDGIAFVTNEAGSHDFISADSTGSVERYAHNLAVKNCSFAANGNVTDEDGNITYSVVGMRLRQGYNITVENVTADGLHSLMQCIGCTGININGVTIENGKSGISLGTSKDVTVKNATISVNTEEGYGLRADASGNGSVLSVEDCEITAYIPVLIRKCKSGNYALQVSGSNTLNETNSDGYWVVACSDDYDGKTELVAPSAECTVNMTINDNGLDEAGIYPVKCETIAQIGNKRYSSIQSAIDAATVAGGEQEITLMSGTHGENVIITQTEGANITIKGDGESTVYTGTISIYGQARYNKAETLTLDGIVFVTNEAGSHDFINADSTGSVERYVHNLTVKNCSFTANGNVTDEDGNITYSVVGMRLRQGYNISVENVTADGLHSLMQCIGCTGININDVTIENGKSGISLGTSKDVTVKNATISANTEEGYGLRADASGNDSVLSVEDCEITAYIPVLIRKCKSGNYALQVSGSNTLNETNSDGYWVVACSDDYDGKTELVAPTEECTVNMAINDNGLDKKGVYPYKAPTVVVPSVPVTPSTPAEPETVEPAPETATTPATTTIADTPVEGEEAEDVDIEDEEVPLADGEENEDVVEDTEVADTEIADEETPLAATSDNGSFFPGAILVIAIIMIAAVGFVLVKKGIRKAE